MSATKQRVYFVVESGTDIRLIRGLARVFELTVLLRPVPSGRAINWPYDGQTPVDFRDGPASRIQFAAWAARQLRSVAPGSAVLVQNYGPLAATISAACRTRRLHCVLLICSPNLEYFRAQHAKGQIGAAKLAVGSSVLRASRNINARFAAHHVVLSPYLASVVGEVPSSRLSVIPVYGVDTSTFVPVADDQRAAIRRALSLPSTGKLVIFSSRVAPEKDTPTLLRAARDLLDRGRDLWFINLSGGHRSFRDLAAEHGVDRRVIARDAVHPERALAPYYQCADLCVQASTEEGLGFSVLEALSCGVPVVASRVGGLANTIRDADTGFTYPVGDPTALAAAVESVFDDPDLARRLTARGREMVKARYDSAHVFDELRDLFARIAPP